jgi:hypothetical protein
MNYQRIFDSFRINKIIRKALFDWSFFNIFNDCDYSLIFELRYNKEVDHNSRDYSDDYHAIISNYYLWFKCIRKY